MTVRTATHTTELARALAEVVPEGRVDDSPLRLAVYARAADFYEYTPQAVVRAVDEAEVRSVLGVARRFGVPVTFRAGGTSLSGQVLGEGIICDISWGFTGCEPREDAAAVWCQPGPTALMVDRILEPLGRRIGPDPASAKAARMGGVVANNAAGMTAGVSRNTYHTLRSMRLVTVDGSAYDSALPADHDRFRAEQAALAQGLLDLRAQVLADAELKDLITRKFSIKCVTGYGINALVDFSDPLDIFTHLVVGSEGTLAFVSEVVLETLPLHPARSSSLLLFSDATACAAAVTPIEEMGAMALELMDDRSMKAAHIVEGLPDFIYSHPAGSCALLVDFWGETAEEVAKATSAAAERIRGLDGLLQMTDFSTSPDEHARLWKLRDDLFGIVAGARKPGATSVLEDMAVPLDELPALVAGIQKSFDDHGYAEGLIFGHASAGNMHFMVSADFSDPAEVARYEAWMQDLVVLVTEQLHGSLKAEHGTGRAVAPFVEREWGPAAYAIMKKVKELADPQGLLNPGVMINDDPEVHAKNFKALPTVWEGIDSCLECGFCEHVCPSRMVALTPRQRIQASRVHAARSGAGDEHAAETLWDAYRYEGIDMCAADGMCGTQCPMRINTSDWTDRLREQRATSLQQRTATLLAKHFDSVEHVARGSMGLGGVADRVGHTVEHVTGALHGLIPWSPVWAPDLGGVPPEVTNPIAEADAVYFPTCVTRILGSSATGKASVAETVLALADRAGIRMRLAEDVVGTCCSQIWEHKGFQEGRRLMAERVVERMWQWSEQGRLPVVCDVTTCTNTLTGELADQLTGELAERYRSLRIVDINDWLRDDVLPKVQVTDRKDRVVIHPTCGCVRSGGDAVMQQVAEACAEVVDYPLNWNCCGTAGDRGFLHPELSDAAQHDELAEIAGRDYDGHYSVARTCEVSLSQRAGAHFESIAYLVEEATRPATSAREGAPE